MQDPLLYKFFAQKEYSRIIDIQHKEQAKDIYRSLFINSCYGKGVYCFREFKSHIAGIVAHGLTNQWLVVVDRKGMCHVLNWKNRQEQFSFSISPSNGKLLCVKENKILFKAGTLSLYDLDRRCFNFSINMEDVSAINIIGQRVYLFDSKNKLHVFDAQSGTKCSVISVPFSNVKIFDIKENKFAAVTLNNKIIVGDVECSDFIELEGNHAVSCLQLVEKDYLIIGTENGTYEIWSLDSKKKEKCFSIDEEGTLRDMKIIQNYILTISSDGTGKIAEWKTGKILATIPLANYQIKKIEVSEGKIVAFAPDEDLCRVYDFSVFEIEFLEQLAEILLGIQEIEEPWKTQFLTANFSKISSFFKKKIFCKTYKFLHPVDELSEELKEEFEKKFLNADDSSDFFLSKGNIVKTVIFEELIEEFEKSPFLSHRGLYLFAKLSKKTQNVVFEKLYKKKKTYLKPQEDYWQCAEHIFYGNHSFKITNKERAELLRGLLKVL